MTDSSSQSSYRHIMKGTAIFGGTQLLSIVINVVKGKLVAHLLGAYGMGISSHLMSGVTPIQQFFTFGLNTSAVKTLSGMDDEQQRASYVKSFRRLLTTLALMAGLSTLVCAQWLSLLTFRTTDHWTWFAQVAVAVVFLMLASGETTILQGYRQLRALALSNIAPPLSGLCIAVPLYWRWGIEGIAPAIVALGLVSWGVARHFTYRLHLPHVEQTWRTTLQQSKGMFMLGATIMTSSVIGSLTIYLTNNFIGYYGSEADIGFYQAANTIILQSTALVFAAMGTDYFPHLASIVHNRPHAQRLVNQEGETVMLIIVPIVMVLITVAPLIIRLFLTAEFDTILFLLRALSLCAIGRAICFPLDYVCIAKGDNLFFFLMEGLWTNLKTLALFVVGYTLGGLNGIGHALLVGAVIDISVSILFNRWRYGIGYTTPFLTLSLPLALTAIGCFAASFIPSVAVAYSLMAVLTLGAGLYCLYQIDCRIHLRNLIDQKFHHATS